MIPTTCSPVWPRAIVHVDMNAFFASVEQRDFPELRDRPVAVTNGEQGTTIITCSYEARAFGSMTYKPNISPSDCAGSNGWCQAKTCRTEQ